MQAYLPDINSKYLMYTRQILSAIPSQKWSTVFGALYAINALLPEDYHVIFSTVIYNDKVKNKGMNCKCKFCEKEHDFKSIKIFELLLSILAKMISGKEIEKVWICSNCNKINKLSETETVITTIAEPSFNKVVTDPPSRKEGLLDRRTYDRKMEQWAWGCLAEIENQMGKFRKDHYKASDDNFNSEDIDTSLEEL